MTAEQLRQKYLKFFQGKNHKILPSASLIPENDPTVLFTTAGMHPLVPYLLGEKHPEGQRLVNCQKCIRTGDIDEVGDNWHLTFFEMLGNWSLGDPLSPDGVGAGYFKKEAIEMSWQFLTDKKWLGLPPEKISISVFKGDKDAAKDEESAKIWQKLGIPPERLYYFPKSENWWGPAGQTGPCGPCTEMFYDTGRPKCSPDCNPSCSCGKYAEIWNNVFMEYEKMADGQYQPLKQKNVDTGMGLERTIAVLNDKDNVYQTELFEPIIKKIEELSNKKYQKENLKPFRIIADHLRAAVFILGDDKGITPSNLDQGYVLRRLIRRSIRYGKILGIKQGFTHQIAEIVIKNYDEIYPELKMSQDFIIEQLVQEEEKFGQTLERGLKEFAKMSFAQKISSQEAFILFSTYGFPLEMTQELAREKNLKVDVKGFEREIKKHQELSRKGAGRKFKGGLADNKKETTRLHTAAHLLLAALRKVLGNHVYQKGSNITAERLRLDFSHSEKLTAEQLKKVEDLVNEQIIKATSIKCEEMELTEAKKRGAMGVFEQKYGDKVKVYTIGNFSQEICGGPHIKNTKELKHFKIIKEESSSAGVRRIKAVLE